MTHTASCRCGQLNATVSGEPVRVSVCHCLDCQKRTGSAFAVQARWPVDQVAIEGKFDDLVAIPLGAFENPYTFTPRFSVWEERKHDWVEILGNVEHTD